jgi:hypothetical protein
MKTFGKCFTFLSFCKVIVTDIYPQLCKMVLIRYRHVNDKNMLGRWNRFGLVKLESEKLCVNILRQKRVNQHFWGLDLKWNPHEDHRKR